MRRFANTVVSVVGPANDNPELSLGTGPDEMAYFHASRPPEVWERTASAGVTFRDGLLDVAIKRIAMTTHVPGGCLEVNKQEVA
jgi:hypothetical protein